MHPLAREYYKQVKKLFELHTRTLIQMRRAIETNPDPKELVDWALALNHSSKFLDDMRKTCNGLEELAEKIACVIYVQAGNKEPIRTPYATGTPDVQTCVSLPNKNTHPDLWRSLMLHLGVPAELVNDANEPVVDMRFKSVVTFLSRQLAEGKPLPPGVDPNKTFPQFRIRLCPRKGVDED